MQREADAMTGHRDTDPAKLLDQVTERSDEPGGEIAGQDVSNSEIAVRSFLYSVADSY